MWHTEGDQPAPPGRKGRYLLAVLALFLALYVVANWQADNAESNREKGICELVAGAGNCVRSGGDWVPRGS